MPDAFGNLTAQEMEWWEGITGGMAGEYITPEEEFAQIRGLMPSYWRQQAPMEDVGRRMRARYALARPYMSAIPTGGDTGLAATEGGFRGPSFIDYMSDPAGAYTATGRAANMTELRARAREAADIAALSSGDFTGEYGPGGTAGSEFPRAAWYRMQLGGQGGRQMQQDIATMLALQRPGPATAPGTYQGAYRGNMASAIRAAMQEIYQGRISGGAQPEDFLDWYLRQTAPATATATQTQTDLELSDLEAGLTGP